MSQDTESPPSISMNNYQLEDVKESTCLRSTVTDHLDMCPELNRRIAGATSIVAKLSKRVWESHKLTTNTKMAVYRACDLSTLLYGSELWNPILAGRKAAQHLPHVEPEASPGNQGVGSNHQQRGPLTRWHSQHVHPPTSISSSLAWSRGVSRMLGGRIPKDLLYGELASGKRAWGRPQPRFKDVRKKDMKALDMDVNGWEDLAQDGPRWRQELTHSLSRRDKKLRMASEEQRQRRKNSQQAPPVATPFQCSHCGRNCRSRIGLYSHSKRCPSSNQ